MNVEIVKMDDFGRGIGYIDNKIIFVPKAYIGEIVNVEIIVDKKNYSVGKILNIVKLSKERETSKCPFYEFCGGCSTLNLSYSTELDYKLNKVNNILNKEKIESKIKKIIKSENRLNYRNKITLKIIDKKIGYYEASTHNLIEIDNCLLVHEAINNLIKDLPLFKVINGEVVIRTNYLDELLIIFKTTDEVNIPEDILINHKIAGIIKNDKCIYGTDFFVDKINDYKFKVSYDSFFQTNPYICSVIFDYIKDNTTDSNKVLDLYGGVGTLGIVASNKAKEVLSVEIIPNATQNGKANALINNVDNIDFITSDTNDIIEKFSEYDTLIIDPPRNGLSKQVSSSIIESNINKIIYISCDPNTLVRDLKILSDKYSIENITLLDMFPNTYHVECACVLNYRKPL